MQNVNARQSDVIEASGGVAVELHLRLWVLSYNFYPVWAGPAERFLRYAPGFRQRGIDTTIITAMRAGQAREEQLDSTSIRRVGACRGEAATVNSFYLEAFRAVLRASPRPDVLLCLVADPICIPLLRLVRALGVATVYVSTMAVLYQETDSRWKDWILRRTFRSLFRSFDFNVSSTATLSEIMTDIGVRPSRQKVISNGVSLVRFRPASGTAEVRQLREKLNLPLDEPIVLYVGLMIDRKGVLELIQAWKQYRARGGHGSLVLVGQEKRHEPAYSAFYERWDRCLAEITAADHIEVRPPSKNVEDFFRAADLMVFLSEVEGMPNVLPEAMACGLPVLTTRFRGFSADFGRDGIDLMTTSRAPSEVCQHLFELLTEPEKLRLIGENGRAWVTKHHTLEESLDKYATLYHRLQKEVKPWRRRLLLFERGSGR